MKTEQASEKTTADFLTIPGLLAILNHDEKVVSREFIYRSAQRGTIPTYRINRKIFVRLQEVLTALRQGE